MAFWQRGLTIKQRRIAVAVGREAALKAAGNKVEFDRLVEADPRTRSIDPALIFLFMKIIMAIFEYYKARNASGLSVAQESDDTVYSNIQGFI
jgi:hypothetical protein